MFRQFLTIFCLGAVFASVGASASLAQECSFTRETLKAAMIASMTYPPGLQDIEVGPFSDGRTVRVQMEYLDTGQGTQVIANSTPRCVSVDRRDAARASLAIDAIEECSARGKCDRLPGYLDGLFRTPEVRDMGFYEDGDAALTRDMAGWCMTPPNVRAWLGRFFQVIGILQFHEIGHVLLHPDGPTSFDREAEADGFAAGFITYGGVAYSDGAAIFASQVEASRTFALGQSHPPAECRVEAFGLGLAGWYARYDRFKPPVALLPDPGSRDLAALGHFLPDQSGLCQRYAAPFHRGVERAFALLTPDTDIRFRTEAFGLRCDAQAR